MEILISPQLQSENKWSQNLKITNQDKRLLGSLNQNKNHENLNLSEVHITLTEEKRFRVSKIEQNLQTMIYEVEGEKQSLQKKIPKKSSDFL